MSETMSVVRRTRLASAVDSSKVNGQATQNRLLLKLPRPQAHKILEKAQAVTLPIHTILNQSDAPIEHVYFVNSGLASILTVLKTGKSVEVGLTGNEGFVGVSIAAGFKTSPTQVMMQIGGSAHRIATKDMVVLMREIPALEKAMQSYAHEVLLQASQIAACNRVHEVDQRLARWLLMSQDRIGGDLVPLTQEFLARMLGSRRASVTVAAGDLQRQGSISYVRGQVKIVDRQRLEASTCECYHTLNRQLQVWRSELK